MSVSSHETVNIKASADEAFQDGGAGKIIPVSARDVWITRTGLTFSLQNGELVYKFMGVEGPIAPDLQQVLQEIIGLLEKMPPLTDQWGRGSSDSNYETDTDSDEQVAPGAVRRRDGNTGVSPTVSTEMRRCSLGLTDSL